MSRPGIYIDICRTFVAKSPDTRAYWNTREYMDQSDLANAYTSAYTKIGWFGGYANLNIETDINGAFANAVLNSTRLQCLRT